MIASMLRYEAEDAAGPTHTAVSAIATCGALASGSEKSAIVRMFKRFAVRMMRHAISPRFATSSESKSRGMANL
eukprot:2759252-Pleurochrysis_carterae.AAC.2